MIQRIQTLFLLIAIGLLTSMFFIPFAELKDFQENLMRFDIIGIRHIDESGYLFFTYHLLIIVAASILVAFFTIIKYKNRVLQIRLCIFNIMLLLGFYSMLFFLVNKVKAHFTATIYFAVPVLFPVLAVILIFLAIRGIRKDIILLRSYDRIR